MSDFSKRVINEVIDFLSRDGLIDSIQYNELTETHFENQDAFSDKLTVDYSISEEALVMAIAEYARVHVLDLKNFNPNPKVAYILPENFIRKKMALPVARTNRSITVAMSDPLDAVTINDINDMTRLEVCVVAVLEEELSAAIGALLSSSVGGDSSMDKLMQDSTSDISEFDIQSDIADDENESEQPIIRLVNMILIEALRRGCSDIHVEPFEKRVRLRYRLDGVLEESTVISKGMQSGIISRIKILAELDISERRIPQDGKFRIRAMGRDIDLRISTLPTVHGEKVVMRILDRGNLSSGLDDLGLMKDDLVKLKLAVANPYGLLLVTGPTGSGKTTTLYSCLQELNDTRVNIITVENPIEYQIEGINQVEISAKVGMTFSAALRSILRQDPDIILVGETRDNETAEIAVKAALTGHLVMTTLHTNSAPGAITRLNDMGIEPFLISSSVVLAQAQRLVRTICPKCKVEVENNWDEDVCKLNGLPYEIISQATLYKGKGCTACGGSGYKGRTAVMEVLLMTTRLKEMVMTGANGDEIAVAAEDDQDFKSLKNSGLQRVLEGRTTLEEVVRIAAAE